MTQGEPYYFFEYDRPPSAKTGRPRKPGATTWRMTIAYAAEKYPGYRPLLDTVEYRSSSKGFDNWQPYAPGTGPLHFGRLKNKG